MKGDQTTNIFHSCVLLLDNNRELNILTDIITETSAIEHLEYMSTN